MKKSEQQMGGKLPPDKATNGSKRKGKQTSSRKNRRKNKINLRREY